LATVTRRIQGLQLECDLLAAEIQRMKTGEIREYDTGPTIGRCEITDLWKDYLRAILAVKRSVIRKLRWQYAVRASDGPVPGNMDYPAELSDE
jgi:hypothetical protein